MRRGIALLLVLSAAGCRDFAARAVSALATPVIYTPVDLGTLGGASSAATDVNASEQIVGQSLTAAGETHAFLFADGVMQDLGTLGGTFSTADDINDNGQIAGRSTTATGEMRAVLWADGTMLDLGLASGRVFLNEPGQVAWSSPTPDGTVHAVLWSGGVLTDLGTLGGAFARVSAINDRGEVVGSSAIPGSSFPEAFVWRDGVMTDLGSFGKGSDAFAINAAGQIVGRSFDEHAESHAVLWDGGTTTDLGTLPGHASATAIAITDLGWVAGESFLSSLSSVHHPFRWQAGVLLPLDPEDQGSNTNQRVKAMNPLGVVVGTEVFFNRIDSAKVWEQGAEWALGTLGGESSVPAAINTHGTVVGRAQDASGGFHAVVWRRLLSL